MRKRAATLALILLLPAAAALAAPPDVSNVSFAQRSDGSRIIDVAYDAADADGDTLTVTLQASDDGGATWIVPVLSVTGDVGPGVIPGQGKIIVWDFGRDNEGWEGDYRLRVLASDSGVSFRAHSPGNYVILDWSDVDWTAPDAFEKYSRADLVLLTGGFLWGNPRNEELRVVDRLKALNPDCRVIGYVLAKTAIVSWQNPDPAHPFFNDFWTRTRPFWSATTTGDTLQDWPGQVVLNILDPACRDAIVGTVAEHVRASANRVDGIFWDYFNTGIWIPDTVDVEGETDLDGDGVGWSVDADERDGFLRAQELLVGAMRDSMGDGFIQILNGQRAYADSAFAALGDGLCYELFPQLFFPEPETTRAAMDPAYPFNLFRVGSWPRDDNGGPFVVITTIRQNFFYDQTGEFVRLLRGNQFRALGLLADTYAAWNSHGSHTYGWTDNEISLGPPTGPTVIDGDRYTRDFRYGRIELMMTSGRHPNAFDYTIWINGRIAEQLAIPYRYPLGP